MPSTDLNLFHSHSTDLDLFHSPSADLDLVHSPSTDHDLFHLPSTDLGLFHSTLGQVANQKFADVVLEGYEAGDVVWVQDYHLMQLPMLLKNAIPKVWDSWDC